MQNLVLFVYITLDLCIAVRDNLLILKKRGVGMDLIQKPWIKLKEHIEKDDYELINNLQEQCILEDKTALKLELDYKLAVAESSKSTELHNINEFMYFNGQELIGYIGICSFGGHSAQLEVNGMVHPRYRRQGVFEKLFELVNAEWKRRNSKSVLLLCDRKSTEGQKFIEKSGAKHHHSEFEMYLRHNCEFTEKRQSGITYRKATNSDALEIARQNALYFNDESESEDNNDNSSNPESMILPENEEKRGMTIFLAEKDNSIIGKVHIELNTSTGGIYGLGVLPEYRGNGYGRELLLFAIEKLKESKAGEIMLQVAAGNDKALNLYKSCGFEETSIMDYHEIRA